MLTFWLNLTFESVILATRRISPIHRASLRCLCEKRMSVMSKQPVEKYARRCARSVVTSNSKWIFTLLHILCQCIHFPFSRTTTAHGCWHWYLCNWINLYENLFNRINSFVCQPNFSAYWVFKVIWYHQVECNIFQKKISSNIFQVKLSFKINRIIWSIHQPPPVRTSYARTHSNTEEFELHGYAIAYV